MVISQLTTGYRPAVSVILNVKLMIKLPLQNINIQLCFVTA